MSCLASGEGKNCWDVTISLCCQRPRTDCQHCDVYINYLKNSGSAQTVVVEMSDGGILVGKSIRAG